MDKHFRIEDRINKRSYQLYLTAGRKDECGNIVGYTKENVYLGGEKATFLEKDGKSYIRIKECCDCRK